MSPTQRQIEFSAEVQAFLSDHPALNISELERHAELPENAFRYTEAGDREIPEKHIARARNVLRLYGFPVPENSTTLPDVLPEGTAEHLVRWLQRRPAIKIQIVEQLAGIPITTLARGIRPGKSVPVKHLRAILHVLIQYGYSSPDLK